MRCILLLLEIYNIDARLIEKADDKITIYLEDKNIDIPLFDLIKMILDIEFKCGQILKKRIVVLRESKVDNPNDYQNYPKLN